MLTGRHVKELHMRSVTLKMNAERMGERNKQFGGGGTRGAMPTEKRAKKNLRNVTLKDWPQKDISCQNFMSWNFMPNQAPFVLMLHHKCFKYIVGPIRHGNVAKSCINEQLMK